MTHFFFMAHFVYILAHIEIQFGTNFEFVRRNFFFLIAAAFSIPNNLSKLYVKHTLESQNHVANVFHFLFKQYIYYL